MSNYWPHGTVYGTLLNFRREREQFAAQMAQAPYKAPPKAPVLYVKTANTCTPSGGHVPVPALVPQVEAGATVALVFGPFALVNPTQSAIQSIAKLVLMCDYSIPHASYFRPPVKFKCLDGFLGVGPQLASMALTDVSAIQLALRVNGTLVQTVDFADLVRSAGELVADVTAFMTPREGDVLMLGLDSLAAGGRPLARVGDVIEIRSPSHPALGVLTNTLTAEGAQ